MQMQYTVYAAANLPARAPGARNMYLYNNTYVLKMLSKNFINAGRIIYFFLLFMYNLKVYFIVSAIITKMLQS